MTLLLCTAVVTVLLILVVVRMPKTSIEEMNHLLSLDEDNLLDRRPKSEPEETNTQYDFSTVGNYVYCHYTARYEGGKHVQIVSIVALSTKAILRVTFEDDPLTYFEFKGSPASMPEIYFEKRYLSIMSRIHELIARHALATAQRIAAKKFLEAQPV
jgi:hypothetical protein